MSEQKLSFDSWWEELKVLADRHNLSHVINWDNPEEYKENDYDEGESPSEALSIHADAWADG